MARTKPRPPWLDGHDGTNVVPDAPDTIEAPAVAAVPEAPVAVPDSKPADPIPQPYRKAPREIERPFTALCEKHKVRSTEAAAIKRILKLKPDGLVLPHDFDQARQAFLSGPAGR